MRLGDNSELVCADGCKDSIYILANNHGIKTPEDFGILACNHFLSTYSQITSVCLNIEDFSWDRIAYEAQSKVHNHAFIHQAGCVRNCIVTLNRKGNDGARKRFAFFLYLFVIFIPADMIPVVVSGLKQLRLIKTAQATFVGFFRDGYRTLEDSYERVLRFGIKAQLKDQCPFLLFSSTNANASWRYKENSKVKIDYDSVWNRAKSSIIESWGGDVDKGVLSTSMQFTLQTAEKRMLESIPEISSIEMLMPNLLYAPYDFSKFKSLTTDSVGNRKIYLGVEKPAGFVFAEMVRKDE